MTRSLKTLSAWTLAAGAFACAGNLWAAGAQDYDQAGLALFRAGQYEKSIQYFNNAVQADPNDAQAYEDMGNAYLKLDDKPNALASYQSALKLRPGDATLQALVDSLGGQVGGGAGASSDGSSDSMEAGPDASSGPAPSTIILQRHPLRRALAPRERVYNDGLAPMDHARIWTSFSLGYDYAAMDDLMKGVDATNRAIQNDGDSGLATFDHSGVGLNWEAGFLLDPNNGLSVGVGWRRTSDLNVNIDFNNGGDYEILNLQPQVVPITLNYYLFLPDKGGRFFLSAGAGYYYGDIRTDKNYDYSIGEGVSDYDDYTGDLTAGGVGFQVGIGRDFAVGQNFGISLFARGYYARLTNFQGNLTDPYGYSSRFGLAILNDGSVDVQQVGDIGGAGGARYATVDFTGFDVGLSVNFYHF